MDDGIDVEVGCEKDDFDVSVVLYVEIDVDDFLLFIIFTLGNANMFSLLSEDILCAFTICVAGISNNIILKINTENIPIFLFISYKIKHFIYEVSNNKIKYIYLRKVLRIL